MVTLKHSPERMKEVLKGLNQAYFGTYTCDLIKEALDYIENLESELKELRYINNLRKK